MSAAVSQPIPALELVFRGSDEVAAFACPTCGALFTPAMYDSVEVARASAEDHCAQRYCECGTPIPRDRVVCGDCWRDSQRERDELKFQIAKKTSEAHDLGDPVYWEGHPGSMGDGIFSSIDEVKEYCLDEDIDLPPYVWACTPANLHIDVEQVLEAAFDDHYEGARDMLPEGAEQELQKLLDEWSGRQKITTWHPDHLRAIVLEKGDHGPLRE